MLSVLRKKKSLTEISSATLTSLFSNRTLSSLSKLVPPATRTIITRNGFTRSLHDFKHKGISRQVFRSSPTTAAVTGENELFKMLGTVTLGRKMVAIWLFASAAWVFSGISRLTRTGISMTDWKFTGGLPPMSDEGWEIEFERYKQSPEYKGINKEMKLDDFKYILWMEYAHRMWGMGLGIMFSLPFSYFTIKGYIPPGIGLRLAGLFTLGAAQGSIGWLITKSGLEEPASEFSEPRLSPYRLASHLTSSLVIYTGLLWTALSVVMPEPPTESVVWVQGAAKVRRLALPASILVGITAVSGAFVAGNDAGRTFNTFPKMGDTWIPDGVLSMKPVVRNFFENTATVQLDHRILATASLVSIYSLWWFTRKLDIHPQIRSLIGSTVGMAAVQVTLGITTLLSHVPMALASAHQAGAVTLLTFLVLLNHTTRRPSLSVLKTLPAMVKST